MNKNRKIEWELCTENEGFKSVWFIKKKEKHNINALIRIKFKKKSCNKKKKENLVQYGKWHGLKICKALEIPSIVM